MAYPTLLRFCSSDPPKITPKIFCNNLIIYNKLVNDHMTSFYVQQILIKYNKTNVIMNRDEKGTIRIKQEIIDHVNDYLIFIPVNVQTTFTKKKKLIKK